MIRISKFYRYRYIERDSVTKFFVSRARSFGRFFNTPEAFLTRGRADPGSSPGLPRGRYPKSGTPHLKPVTSVDANPG